MDKCGLSCAAFCGWGDVGGSREACPEGKEIQTIDSMHFMDKDTLYQKGLKLAQGKGYTGEFVLHFAEGFVQGYEEGRIQAINEIAEKLKQMGLDKQIISQCTRLYIEEI